MSNKEIYTYKGKEVDVDWDGRLCIHMGECGYAKGDLFISGRDPWCQPDLTSVEETLDVVKRCPTGALVFKPCNTNLNEVADKQNTVMVSYNGPYFIRGELDLKDAPTDMSGVSYRVALCRCGLSKNKPFCDNSHLKGKFEDYGAVGESGTSINQKGGVLKIKAMKDGPLILNGNVSVSASSGREAWQGDSLALCRCGSSKNKPFCDGSHVAAGFKSQT